MGLFYLCILYYIKQFFANVASIKKFRANKNLPVSDQKTVQKPFKFAYFRESTVCEERKYSNVQKSF